MSDEWNHDQQHHDQNQGNWQGEQSWQSPEGHQENHQPVETFNSPVEPVSEMSRFEAIEAAITELKANVEALKADRPAAVIHPVSETHHGDAAEHASAASGDKLAAIETELAALRELVTTIAGDVKSHADLHAETRAIVDEQHQLMRGLNYIITSAIGTLTSAAKQPK